MKLVFVGTSHGVPEAHRKNSCTMVEIGDRRYFVDMGCDVNEMLTDRGLPYESVKGVFITHPHCDHSNGLIPFVSLIGWHYTQSAPKLLLPSQRVVNGLMAWMDAAVGPNLQFDIELTRDGLVYDDGVLKVTAYATQHCPHSFGYLLEAEGKRVLFTGDLKGPEEDFPDADDLDLVVCEGAHFDVARYREIFRAKKPGSVYLHHYVERSIAPWAALREEFSFPLILTNDDMEVVL